MRFFVQKILVRFYHLQEALNRNTSVASGLAVTCVIDELFVCRAYPFGLRKNIRDYLMISRRFTSTLVLSKVSLSTSPLKRTRVCGVMDAP